MADNGWTQTRLGDVIDIKHGYAFEGQYFRDDPPGDVLLTPGNFAIGGGFKSDKLKYYGGPVPDEFVLREGDLLISMTDLSKQADTLGYPAVVPPSGAPRFLHNQRLGKVVIRPNAQLDRRFLYYVLCSNPYRHEVLASATGTTVKHTSPNRIMAYQFHCPPLAEQRAIANVLATLDDKIELNRRMNETLEAMPRAIFKSWFIDATEASNPKGWRKESIYVAAEVIYGAPFSSAKFNTERVGKPLIRIRDLADESPGVFTLEEHPKGYVVKPGDIVVGMDGEFRAYVWGGEESWLNQRVCVFAPKPGFSAAFVLNSIISPLAEVEATETATTVIHLGKNDIDRFKIVLPDKKVLSEFNRLAQPLFDRIVLNKQESRTLAALRDALLPKLLSGEINISEHL